MARPANPPPFLSTATCASKYLCPPSLTFLANSSGLSRQYTVDTCLLVCQSTTTATDQSGSPLKVFCPSAGSTPTTYSCPASGCSQVHHHPSPSISTLHLGSRQSASPLAISS